MRSGAENAGPPDLNFLTYGRLEYWYAARWIGRLAMRRRDFIAGLGETARGRLAALCELITPVVRTVVIALAFVVPLRAQDLMRNLDLTSPDMTTAEKTRADVEKALASHDTDFNGKKLSGLD